MKELNNAHTNLEILHSNGISGRYYMSKIIEYKKEIITGIITLFLLYFCLKYILPLITPFLLAFITIYSIYPLLYKMEQKCKINKTITSVIFIVFIVIILLLILWLIGYLAGGNLLDMFSSNYELNKNMNIIVNKISFFLQDKFNLNGIAIEKYLNAQMQNGINSLESKGLSDMMTNSFQYLRRVLPALAFIGIYLVATILLSRDFDLLMEKVHKIGALDAFMSVMEGLLHTIGTYLKAQFIIMLVISTICCTGLRLTNISYPFFLGILAGILDVLPFIGTGVVLIPTAIIQLINGKILKAVVCVILYVLCIGAREFLEPKLMGKKLGIYPVILLLSIYAGVKLFGIAGIIKGPLGVILFKQLFVRIFPVKS